MFDDRAHGSKTLLPQIDEPVDCDEEILENDTEIQNDGNIRQEGIEEMPEDDVESKSEEATSEQSVIDNGNDKPDDNN